MLVCTRASNTRVCGARCGCDHAGAVARLRYGLLLAFLLALAFSGSAEPFSLRQDDVSLGFQDLGPVLTAAEVGLPAGPGPAEPNAAPLPAGPGPAYSRGPPPRPSRAYSAPSA